jgi:hypothetical protein
MNIRGNAVATIATSVNSERGILVSKVARKRGKNNAVQRMSRSIMTCFFDGRAGVFGSAASIASFSLLSSAVIGSPLESTFSSCVSLTCCSESTGLMSAIEETFSEEDMPKTFGCLYRRESGTANLLSGLRCLSFVRPRSTLYHNQDIHEYAI